MLVVLKPQTPEATVADVGARLRMAGLAVHRTEHDGRVRFAAVGDLGAIDPKQVESWSGVESVAKLSKPFKLASRAFHPHDTVISVGRIAIGGPQIAVMAGPCSVEGEEQMFTIAKAVAEAGATVLRGGAFKPRTSPYAFQGLGEEGLKLMRRAADAYGLAVVSEVMEPDMVPLLARYSDILQIGARNMQNYALLRVVGHTEKPILLKRGLSSTIEEWLLSAEHIMARGNRQVMLCERGIRTFETYTRNTLDLNAVPVVKELSHLPVIVDPSHGVGIRNKVAPMARASIAAGADGVIVEVHHDPDRVLSDGAQSLYPEQFAEMVKQIRTIAEVVGRTV
ncbi:MAG: 3-deoxy-7-phosphoheptulonate synthase [Candidatus Eisenbacteria bacterium]|nr:3-deoxy-7-phosphoheptulonate synthase [Candidatus Eisenbacteria bacterium]